MPDFVAEQYLSGTDSDVARRAAGRARLGAGRMTKEGTRIELVCTIFIPGDETCLYIYRADSSDVVRQAGARCSVRFDRISEALTDLGAGEGAR